MHSVSSAAHAEREINMRYVITSKHGYLKQVGANGPEWTDSKNQCAWRRSKRDARKAYDFNKHLFGDLAVTVERI